MKHLFFLLFIILISLSCSNNEKEHSYETIDWTEHFLNMPLKDSLETGKTYLSTYPEIYSFSKHKTHNLTTLVSLRNISETDTIFVSRADYYNTKGLKIKKHLLKSIYLKPLETIEIVIDENDSEGGTGANFIFEWHKKPSTNEPFFEAVMSSTMAQQGLSFTTQGLRIN